MRGRVTLSERGCVHERLECTAWLALRQQRPVELRIVEAAPADQRTYVAGFGVHENCRGLQILRAALIIRRIRASGRIRRVAETTVGTALDGEELPVQFFLDDPLHLPIERRVDGIAFTVDRVAELG